MAVSINAAILDIWLNYLRSTTAVTALTGTTFIQLHTANPGTAGTTSVATQTGLTTRASATFGAAAAVSGNETITMSGTPTWTNSGASTETVTHISVWTASTAGTFLWSSALTASAAVPAAATFNLTSASLGIASAS